MYKKIIISAVAAFVLITGVYLSFQNKSDKKRDIIHNARSCFQNEQEYIEFMKNEVDFENITFKFVTVQSGSNFWKIAKEYGVNIDTLIGANLFWEDLRARTGQVVIVPSEAGTIAFIEDMEEMETLADKHNVDISEIQIQKLPFLYGLYYKFMSERKPVAVFIKDAKPSAGNMTAKLAGKYQQRELFRSPLGGRLSSFFGNRKHPIYQKTRFHNGLDIAASHGTLIGAARDGVVVGAGWNGAYGKAVTIDHGDGYRTLYGHMSVIYAKPGQRVKAGKIIGRVGSTGLSTGPHLHFTLWHNDRLLNPMDILW